MVWQQLIERTSSREAASTTSSAVTPQRKPALFRYAHPHHLALLSKRRSQELQEFRSYRMKRRLSGSGGKNWSFRLRRRSILLPEPAPLAIL